MNINFAAPDLPDWLASKLCSKTFKKEFDPNRPKLKFMEEGARNDQLTSAAGHFRRNHKMGPEELFEVLSALNHIRNDPVSDKEVWSISQSIGTKNDPVRTAANELELSRQVKTELLSDHRRTLQQGWMAFAGIKWKHDEGSVRVKERIKRVLENIHAMAVATGDLTAAKSTNSFMTLTKLKAVLELVGVDPDISVDIDDFDINPDLLNLENGTLSLSNHQLAPHRAEQLLSKSVAAEFDPSATCPNFDKLLRDILPTHHQAFALRLFGYALLGDPREQVFVIFQGPGANGKSTLVNAVQRLLGDYATTTEPSTFIKKANEGIRNDLAALKGARMVTTAELATGEILDAPLIKRTTGGDELNARFLFGEYFSFKPKFVLFMVTNAPPVIAGGDQALTRRIVLLPFNNVIPEDQRDARLSEKLEMESSGILNRLLEGARDYQRNGLSIPDDLKAAAEKYAVSSDMIGAFIDDECEIGADYQEGASELYQRYRVWAVLNGLKPLSNPQFKNEMATKHGTTTRKTNKGHFWPGLRLRSLSMPRNRH